ncbi:MAG: shikimate dehydrogenase [Chloroflexota bacterium]
MLPTGKTSLLGLLGWPVSHSKSPAMHSAAARAAGLDYLYVPLSVHPAAVGDALRGLPALGMRGVNVTVPHKQAVIPFLDEIDPAAAALGSVNTIVITQSSDNYAPHLKGYSTDGTGFLTDLEGYGVTVSERACIVVGGGGSARAVIFSLIMAGATVYLATRRAEQGQEVVEQLGPHLPPGRLITQRMADIPALTQAHSEAVVVHTTPVGMTPKVEHSVWNDSWSWPKNGFLYDLVYTPAETKIMQQAKAAGLPAVNGLGMLLHQGAAAFTLWTGLEPDIKVMREAIRG